MMLLLADLRTPEKKFADAMVEAFRTTFPLPSSMWSDDRAMFPAGGTITGRYRRDEPIPYMQPRGEFVVPNSDPRLNRPDVDYARVECRLVSEIFDVKLPTDAEILARIDGKEDLLRSFAERQQEKMYRLALYGERYKKD